MNRLYQKNEIGFAILWIVIYVVGMSSADSISESIGIAKIVTLPLIAAMSLFLYVWLKKYGLQEKYGLCKAKRSGKEFLFFIPLLLVIFLQLAEGISINHPASALMNFVFMLFVGFMEELIFRGFLFKAMEPDGLKSAVIVSAFTFGIGHIVNLFNGSQDMTLTLLQIVFAVFFGFCMVFLFYKGGSLLPCIAAHGFFNAFNAIAPSSIHFPVLVIQMVLLAAYSFYLYRLADLK